MPNFVAPFIGVGVALKAPTADGTANQVIETDGAGNLSFVDAGAGGSPGGSDTQFQYNNGGAFGGIGSVTFDDTNDYVVAGSHTYTAASGTDLPVSITPTYNQTSTAAATDLLINRTQTAVGSGNQRLIDLQVGGTSRARVNNQGTATLTPSGTTISGLQVSAPASYTGKFLEATINAVQAYSLEPGNLRFTTTGAACHVNFVSTSHDMDLEIQRGGTNRDAFLYFKTGSTNDWFMGTGLTGTNSNWSLQGKTSNVHVIEADKTNDRVTFGGKIRLVVQTDATRGAAGTNGRVIFNSDDANLNIDDGTNWILPDGTTT